MTARLADCAAPTRPTPTPDAGYAAVPRLTRLAADLASAARRPRPRWKEPPVFFFDPRRQAALKAARPPAADPHAELAGRVAAEMPMLCASVEVRHVARAVPGLAAAAAALAPTCPAAADLAAVLAVPDDEVFVVLRPAARTGFRLAVRGVAEVGRFHALMAAATGDPAARFQMYTPAALGPDGELPTGFGGCDHWLWPEMPLAAVPRVGGERVVLLGPPAFRAAGEVGGRFPGMAADVRVLEVLNPFRVADRLARPAGRPVPVVPKGEPGVAAAKAA
ncbi:MAG: hypothetical protein C0501_20480 [Isosphaera sp.]|nr:hypothetical protein [Isosphaera sp.]